jgi:hypothetical protein
VAKFSVTQVNQLEVELGNQPGAIAKLASALADGGVSIQGFTAVSEHHDETAVVHFVTDQDTEAMKVLEAIGLKPTDTKILALHCSDAPGVLAKLTSSLGDAGINISNLYTSVAENADGATIFMEVAGDTEQATKVIEGIEL